MALEPLGARCCTLHNHLREALAGQAAASRVPGVASCTFVRRAMLVIPAT